MTPSTNQFLEDEDESAIDVGAFRDEKQALQDSQDEEGTIDLDQYRQSEEAKQADWWDTAKEAGLQAASGLAQAFTWPLDVIKMALVGEGLSDIDDLEQAFEKAGKPFDRNKYIQTVMEQADFFPTQELLQRQIDKNLGTNINDPQTKTGKFFNKLFFLSGLARGKGVGKAAKSGLTGASTTAALREAGAPEIVSELAGDFTGGLATVGKEVRKFSPEQQRIMDIAEKHGLPLMEFMLQDNAGSTAKISAKRKAALEKNLGMSTQEAINQIVDNKIPVSKLRKEGINLETLEQEAFDIANDLAKKNPKVLNTSDIVEDIDREISRIKSQALSPSSADQAAIRVLNREKKALTNAPKKQKAEILGPNGEPLNTESNARTPKKASVQKLIEQTRKFNSNVKGIYKKSEFSGVEDEVKNAYAFLNESIRNTIERNTGKEVVDAHRLANTIFAQNSALARTDGLIAKAFQNDTYSPKKLNQVLNSKQGVFLRRELGKDGVNELKDIANFGEKAQKATAQFANSAPHQFKISEWGPLAGFLLSKRSVVGPAAIASKPIFDYVRGWALTRPVARQTYANIVKNAAKGSFSNMGKDFSKLENEVIKEYGSIDDFMKQGINELQFYRLGEEDED